MWECVSLGTNWGSISNTKIFQQQNIFNSYSQSFLHHSFYFSFTICSLVQLWEQKNIYAFIYLWWILQQIFVVYYHRSSENLITQFMLSFIMQHCNWHFFASHSRNSCLLNIVIIISGTSIVISSNKVFFFLIAFKSHIHSGATERAPSLWFGFRVLVAIGRTLKS